MADPIFALADGYVTASAALDPVAATYQGIAGHDHAGTDYGPDGAAARADLIRDTLRRLAATPGGDRLAASHLRERLEARLAWYDSDEWMRDLAAAFGRVQAVRESVDLVRRDGPDGWQPVVARLAAVPAMLASWRESLSLGLSRGLPAARRQAVETADAAAAYAAGTHDALVAAYGTGPLRDDLAAAAAAAHAAYRQTATYLRGGYVPAAADGDGVGPDRHRVFSRLSLGADIDAREAYEWGWAELHRIEDELAAEAGGRPLDEVEAALDATEYVDGPDAYRAWLQDEHDAAIARADGVHFDIHPDLRRVEVVLAPASNVVSVYYTGPSEDLVRPGRTWWSVGGRERFSVWQELTTAFHEGVPGHHLQIGQSRVAGDRLSRFSRFNGVSGHSEGWALYAERLADELGWYDRPGTRLGMLKDSALRAARVVIDIGLHLDLPLPAAEARRHGPRWTFEVAEAVLRERGRCAEHRVRSEIIRYCGWPAQATAYKLGERVWLAARDEARARQGAGFDLKRWHTEAIGLGPLGLDTFADALRERG
ncbi:DUF885 domain-containing protein [Planosporangium sp. 12N6]|uniref:DUF885 domain-containing protein n=1 Tax=Planosporangium spinosum TaxID=3402278 RepID=UPI003CED1123